MRGLALLEYVDKRAMVTPSRVGEILGVILDPTFWSHNEPISHEWSMALDAILNDVLSGAARIRLRTEHVVLIGDCAPIWIANYPYAYGKVRGGAGLPTRRVRKKLAAVIAAYDVATARRPQPNTDGAA